MIIWSYGGGTQSVAIAVLIDQGRLPRPDMIVMADTGRERAATWRYLNEHVTPLLARHGLQVEIAPRSLASVDLYSKKSGDLLLPAFTAKGKMPTFCSNEWKKRVVRRYLRSKGVKHCDMWLGMSLDEVERMKDSDADWIRHRYPLGFDVPMTRGQCRQLVLAHGLPEPPRSCCWMCPHMSDAQWRDMKANDPADWQQAIEMDEAIRQRDEQHNVYLHRSCQPLSELELSEVALESLPLFAAQDECDTGYCFV